MGRDVRKFQVYLADDDALIWRLLEAIETAAEADASSRGLEVDTQVEVEHPTGEYARDTVAEALETSRHNDFAPGRVSLRVSLARTDARPGGDWVRAARHNEGEPLSVVVVDDSPPAVDRVLAVLRESANATPGATVGAGRVEQVDRRHRDSRKFQLAVPDDATLWQVLAAIEAAATDDATGRGLAVSTDVDVEHATGKYVRDTVAEAREFSQRNDFAPGLVRFQVSLAQTGRYADAWVQVVRYRRGDPLTVEVTERNPAELDRVLAVLQEPAAATPGATVGAGRDKQLSWRDRDTRKFQVPLPDDDATLWQVLQTIESSAKAEAAAKSQSLATELRVGDASGEYTRSTVAEARDTLARNYLVPRSIDFRLTFKPPGDTSSWLPSDEGIAVRRYNGDRPLSVEIALDDEVELNRMFTTLQETFDAELRTSPGSLGSTDKDTRKFRVETADDVLLWRVLEAVASAAEDAARHADRTVAATLSIGHSTGEYVRSTVADAKATSQKNGFSAESVDFRLFRIGPDADLTLRHVDPWLRVSRNQIDKPLVIEILSGNEIEVSGVFNKLQDHVKAAIQSTQDGTNNAVLVPPSSSAPPAPRWKRILNHGWTVEVVGGLTAAVGGGLIIAWIVSR